MVVQVEEQAGSNGDAVISGILSYRILWPRPASSACEPTTSLILTTMAAPVEFSKYIDDKADAFIQRLADAVAIPSYVSQIHLSARRSLMKSTGSVEMLSAEEM